MHDTSFDDTLLVPRLPPDDPVRELPASFAPARIRRWPWIAAAVALLAIAAAKPVDLSASQRSVERTLQADTLIHDLAR